MKYALAAAFSLVTLAATLAPMPAKALITPDVIIIFVDAETGEILGIFE